MPLEYSLKIRIYEDLQHLHQFSDSLKVYFQSAYCDWFEIHLRNLPRISIVSCLEEASVVVGRLRDLSCSQISNPTIILTDKTVPIISAHQLLSQGYRFHTSSILRRLLTPLPESKRLKILVVTNLYPPQELGGYGRSIYDFVSNLRLLGHSVFVLTSNAPYLPGNTSNDISVSRSLVLHGSYENGLSIIDDSIIKSQQIAHNSLTLSSYLSSNFFTHSLIGNMDMLDLSLLKQLSDHGIRMLHHYGFSEPSFPLHLLPSFSHYKPLANSHYSSGNISSKLKIFPPIDVIYPGAQTNLFEFLPMLPLSHGLQIVFAGLLIDAKGPSILLKALSILKEKSIPFSCTIAGYSLSPSQFNQYLVESHQLGLADSVKFVGRLNRDQLASLYTTCNTFVFPSVWAEPFGISQVEALSAGLLVVSSGTGGSSEPIQDDLTGRRFIPGNAESLALVLQQINLRPDHHQKLRLYGRQVARRFFDTSDQTAKLSSLFSAFT